MKQITSFLEARFKLSENGTCVRTEAIGGITTFLTMAYILAVNPSILAVTGMDKAAILVATAVAAAAGSILMALLANYPFALAPGMGLNAFFAFTVVLGMGYSWQFALTAVLVEGLIFLLLSLTSVREQLFDAIPSTLKVGVGAGIGLFIAFIGLQNAKIVVDNPATLVSFYDFSASPFAEQGITVLLAMVGVLLIGIMLVKKIKGAVLFGILATWAIGIFCELTGVYMPNPELGTFSILPNFEQGFELSAISNTFMQFEFKNIATLDFVVIMFSFLFVDMFDTLGTLIGVSTQANMLDKDGKLPRIKGALLSDSIATILGAILGTSTTTTYVESSAGVNAGARTGLAALITGGLFLISLLLAPVFMALPAFATAPALIVVGLMMLKSVLRVDFDNFEEAIPAYVATISMPFFYSISEGICLGVISYTVLKIAIGKTREVHPIIAVLSVIFVLKYALI